MNHLWYELRQNSDYGKVLVVVIVVKAMGALFSHTFLTYSNLFAFVSLEK